MPLYFVHSSSGRVKMVVAEDMVHLYRQISEDTATLKHYTYWQYRGEDMMVQLMPKEPLYSIVKEETVHQKTVKQKEQVRWETHKESRGNPQESVKAAYEALFKAGSGDITVEVGDKSIKCLKGILAERSEYFKDLIEDTSNPAHEDVIKIQNFDYDIVELLIRYMYTAKLDLQHLVDAKIENEAQHAYCKPGATRDECNLKEKLCKLLVLFEVIDAAIIFKLDCLTTREIHDLFRETNGVIFAASQMDLSDIGNDTLLHVIERMYALCKAEVLTGFMTAMVNAFIPMLKRGNFLNRDVNSEFLNECKELYYEYNLEELHSGKNEELAALLRRDDFIEDSPADQIIDQINALVQDGACVTDVKAAHLVLSHGSRMGNSSVFNEVIWEVVDHILTNLGYDINLMDKSHQTLLHIALAFTNKQYVLRLLRKGADPRIRNSDDESCYDIALREADSHMATIIWNSTPSQDNINVILSHNMVLDRFRIRWEILELMKKNIDEMPADSDGKKVFSFPKKGTQIVVSEEFIRATAYNLACESKKEHRDCTTPGFCELVASSLDFEDKNRTYSNLDLHAGIAAMLMPDFMEYVHTQQALAHGGQEDLQQVSVEEWQQLLHTRLKDELERRIQPENRQYLCSMRALHQEGYLDGVPEDSWVHRMLALLQYQGE